MKQPVDVDIMGVRLTVASDDGVQHVREVAAYVDGQMRQLASGCTGNAVQIALLTALNIASEYRKLHREREELDRVMARLSKRVSSRLEE